MTIRIYALAKDLNKTNKELNVALKDLGIPSGSALKSLTDEEVRLITNYFSEKDGKATETDGANALPEMVSPQSMTPPPSKTVQVIPQIKPRAGAFTHFFGGTKKKSAEPSVQVADDSVRSQNESDNKSTFSLGETKVEEITDVETPSASAITESRVDIADSSAQVETECVEASSNSETQDVVQSVVSSIDTVATDEAIATQNTDVEVSETQEFVESVAVADVSVCTSEQDVKEDVIVRETSVDEQKANEAKQSSNVAEVDSPVEQEPKASEAETPADSSDDKTATSVSVQEVVQTSENELTVKEKNTGALSKSSSVAGDSSAVSVDNSQKKASEVKPISSQSGSNAKKSGPLSDATSRKGRESRDHRSDRNNDRKNNQQVVKPAEVRPVPRPTLPAYAQPDRWQALDEMKRPPMITSRGGNGRIQVLGGQKKNEGSSNNAGSGSRSGRSNVSLHLAPMPSVSAQAQPKKSQEQTVAQKPIRAFNLAEYQKSQVAPLAHLVSGAKNRKPEGSVADKKNGSGDSKDKNRGSRASNMALNAQNPRSFESSNMDGGHGSGKRGSHVSTRNSDFGRQELGRKQKPTRRGGNNKLLSLDDEDGGYVTRGGNRGRKNKGATIVTAPRINDIVIEPPCTVKDFSEATGKSVAEIIKTLMKLGMISNINQVLENEVLELLIMEFGLKATIKQPVTLEEQFVDTVFTEVDPPESLVPRAPVVTFLGHVDHGKTSLLDRILHLQVVSGEKGGITQHIRAYRISTPKGDVTFVDTPGHEAFTEMRARGANCTDIAVLVVAADDGVMPQTEEAISHAKAAGVPIVVALNKMDLPGVNREKVIQGLANNDLMPSEWGGDIEVVETSAITGMGVDDLLETLLTVAELSELKANPNRRANGVVLEASLEAGEGVVCKALVQNGTLKNGDVVLCGSSYGRVRSMTDTLDSHKRIKEAGPSVPISLVGLDVAPEAGSKFVVLEDISVARQIAEERAKRAREVRLAGSPSHVTLESLFDRINSAKSQQTLNVIIRADVRGSIEAIRKEMGKLEHPEVKVKILQASVGGITEADVHLADASDAIIVGFNVVPDEGARSLAETKKVQVRRYDIIYKLTEDIRSALEGMLKPIEQVKELGRARVQRAFNISRVGVIAGSRVIHGTIERNCQIRVIRDSRVIGKYTLETLKREKDDAKEVHEGFECGIKLKNFNDIKEGDILEAFKIEEVARTFD